MQREKEKGADTRNRLDPFSRNPRAPTESDREITAVVVICGWWVLRPLLLLHLPRFFLPWTREG